MQEIWVILQSYLTRLIKLAILLVKNHIICNFKIKMVKYYRYIIRYCYLKFKMITTKLNNKPLYISDFNKGIVLNGLTISSFKKS
jgi:hypothetical protein